MPADRHPSQELRAACRAGDTSPGTALALTVHAEVCAACRLDAQRSAAPARGDGAGIESQAIGELRQSTWRWLAPGVRAAELHGASGLGEAIYLLKLAPGRAIPSKGLSALSHLVILAGALRDGEERYQTGDYLDAEAQPPRRPVAERPEGCLCLVVTDGTWPGPGLSRLLSPLRGRDGG